MRHLRTAASLKTAAERIKLQSVHLKSLRWTPSSLFALWGLWRDCRIQPQLLETGGALTGGLCPGSLLNWEIYSLKGQPTKHYQVKCSKIKYPPFPFSCTKPFCPFFSLSCFLLNFHLKEKYSYNNNIWYHSFLACFALGTGLTALCELSPLTFTIAPYDK